MRYETFDRIASHFMQIRKIAGEFFLEKIPNGNPTSRFLRAGKKTFVIKILTESSPTDKNVFHLQNEIIIQAILRNLDFLAKRYLLVELNSDNPARIPFAVSTYIPGKSLSEINKEKIALVIPNVLDYLFLLHSRTISQSFGYLEKATLKEFTIPFGQFESIYLRADILRDGIDLSFREKKNLNRAIEILNQAELFCLCHWDVTRRNTLIDDSVVHLIDWSYAHYAHPASDIAGVTFWLMELGLKAQMRRELVRSCERYQRLGFNIASLLPFYLAQRYIEVGRFRGRRYVRKGKKLLECMPVKSLEEIIKKIWL